MTYPQSIEELQVFMDKVPFNRVLQMQLDDLKEGFCRLHLPFKEEFIGDPVRYALHGGVISAAMDTCGGAALWAQIGPQDHLSTIDMRVDFLRKGEPQTLVIEAQVLRLGNRVGVTEMVAYHPQCRHEPVASGKGVYNVRRKSES